LKQVFLEALQLNSTVLAVKPNGDVTEIGLIFNPQERKLRNTYALFVALGSIWQTF
jgi:hypothetical protein